MRRYEPPRPRGRRPACEVDANLGPTGLRSPVDSRPRTAPAGRLRRLVLTAFLCLPALAGGAARAGDLAATAPDGAGDPGPRDEGQQLPSFGLDGRPCGLGTGMAGSPFDPSPTGYSLCAELGPSRGPEERGPAAWTAPPEAEFRPGPRAPLRGVRNDLSPLGRKYLRGTLIITGTALASGVVLAVMPKEFSKWEDDAYSRGGSNFVRAWSELPVWDGDVAFHNWIGHPYAGAFYYNMMRSQGGTIRQSFAFAVFQSVMWEYVIEAVAEQPSIQDLIATPIMGSVVGELFNRWSVAILRKGRLNLGQKALVFFLNPAYVMNNGYRPPE